MVVKTSLPPNLAEQIAKLKANDAKPKQGRINSNSGGNANGQAPPQMVSIDLARYDTEPIPDREWGVRDRFPRRNVALLSGHGGAGKSLLLLQLAVAHALGKDWLRSLPEPGPVIVVNCEDEPDELVRRLAPILNHCHASFADVADNLHIFPLATATDGDASNQLLANAGRDGILRVTPLYRALLARACEIRPICVVIDNVADVFGGLENDRSMVRQFINLVRRIAIAANGYVIMSSHPSLTGIASKTGLSGSTQWHNSVRARAYLRGPNKNGDDNDNNSAPTETRVLEFQKSNYSAIAEQIELKWANGLYLPAAIPSAPEQAAANNAADAMFLQLLEKCERNGDNASPKRTSNNFAPCVFANTPEARKAHLSRQHFEDALDRLVAADQIAITTYGAPSKRAARLVRRRLL
jgi:RecA-family ATPase